MEQIGDVELIQLFRTDKNSAEKVFTELYNRYSPGIYAFCRRFLGDRSEAQDIYQETFIKFHQAMLSDKDITNVLGFLLTIARNMCINSKRRAAPTVTYNDFIMAANDNRNESDELLNLIKSCIDLLPDEYRELFILREYDGMSYIEIANITQTNVNTIKVKLFRAKKKLRTILEPYMAEMNEEK